MVQNTFFVCEGKLLLDENISIKSLIKLKKRNSKNCFNLCKRKYVCIGKYKNISNIRRFSINEQFEKIIIELSSFRKVIKLDSKNNVNKYYNCKNSKFTNLYSPTKQNVK